MRRNESIVWGITLFSAIFLLSSPGYCNNEGWAIVGFLMTVAFGVIAFLSLIVVAAILIHLIITIRNHREGKIYQNYFLRVYVSILMLGVFGSVLLYMVYLLSDAF